MEWHQEHIEIRDKAQDILLMNEPVSDSPELKKVITSTALIIIDGNVMKTYINADTEFTAEDADANVEACWNYIKDKKICHILIPDSTTHVTLDASNYANPKFEALIRAEAMVLKSLAHRILAKAFTMKRRNKYPIKVFGTEEEASLWLKQVCQNQS